MLLHATDEQFSDAHCFEWDLEVIQASQLPNARGHIFLTNIHDIESKVSQTPILPPVALPRAPLTSRGGLSGKHAGTGRWCGQFKLKRPESAVHCPKDQTT